MCTSRGWAPPALLPQLGCSGGTPTLGGGRGCRLAGLSSAGSGRRCGRGCEPTGSPLVSLEPAHPGPRLPHSLPAAPRRPLRPLCPPAPTEPRLWSSWAQWGPRGPEGCCPRRPCGLQLCTPTEEKVKVASRGQREGPGPLPGTTQQACYHSALVQAPMSPAGTCLGRLGWARPPCSSLC